MQAKRRQFLVNLYYENVVIGEEMFTDTHTVIIDGISTIINIARDRHPRHPDPDYRAKDAFKRPIAHRLF